MNPDETDGRALEDRANELYWASDIGVNQIAEQLELSKGALYDLIAPLPGALACPACRAETVFANRTARDRSLLSCVNCGWEGDVDEAGPPDSVVPDEEAVVRSAWRARSALELPLDNRTMLGGALLGAAVGLGLVFWARRR